MSRFLELLINPLSHEEPVASQHCGQPRGFIPICDITGNELPILSVYHSSNLIAFGATNVCNGSRLCENAIWPILQPARNQLAAFCVWFFARKHKPVRLRPLPNMGVPQIEDQPATCLANIPSGQ